MKRFLAITTLIFSITVSALAQPKHKPYEYPLQYFFPSHINFQLNPEIPTPESVLGFQVAQQHADWGQVVAYMHALAQASNRVVVRNTATTYQHRPFIEVVISSPANISRLEELRSQHLDNCYSTKSQSKDAPVVVSIVGSMHGNEATGVNSTLATAYLFTAAQCADITALLDKTIIVITPGANPDGINRFASWVNTNRSFTDVPDTNSREFSEPWPSSRTNHYWIDCNRDLIMAQHPEGVNALDTYFHWMPNVLADLHEQGSARPFYMSPGHPKRTHQLTPQENQDLTVEVSSYVATELDSIGTTYYSKEGYDDYYYGKGAAYGDIHGSVCLLYEQGTTRGHLRKTADGIRHFAWGVRNQAISSYATILAAYKMREKLLDYQHRWFTHARDVAKSNAVKGYIFNCPGNNATMFHFLENLNHHQIKVYRLAKSHKSYSPSDSYVVPIDQPNSVAIKALFEDFNEFTDSTFYDISAWTVPRAFNVNYTTLSSTDGLLGALVEKPVFHKGKIVGGLSEIAYVLEATEFYNHKVIYELLKMGVCVKVSTKPFKFKSTGVSKKMGYGTVIIPAKNQPVDAKRLYEVLTDLAAEAGTDIYAATTSLQEDVDFGSPAFKALKLPKVAVIGDRSASVADAGEVWFLLDHRFQMQPTMMESADITASKLKNYTTLIMAGGAPALGKSAEAALKDWVEAGGTLILSGKAYSLANKIGLTKIETKSKSADKKEKSASYLKFGAKNEASAGKSVSGVILNCKIDKSHPVAWGLNQDEIAVMKRGNIFFETDTDPYASPMHYAKKPRLSGFLSAKNESLIANSPAMFAKSVKSGNVVITADDLNFRSYFFGTSKIFMNSIFFSNCF